MSDKWEDRLIMILGVSGFLAIMSFLTATAVMMVFMCIKEYRSM
jgi:hypothetical protein